MAQSFDQFYKDLKETEEKDSVLTPKQQIERLLRPGESSFQASSNGFLDPLAPRTCLVRLATSQEAKPCAKELIQREEIS